jgi:hypothetical protein
MRHARNFLAAGEGDGGLRVRRAASRRRAPGGLPL